jgi:hypothetical protein
MRRGEYSRRILHFPLRIQLGSLSVVSEARGEQAADTSTVGLRFRYNDLKEAAWGCGGRGCYANSIEGK